MKMTLESTGQIETVHGVPARLWKGKSEGGIPLLCWIPIIRADYTHACAEQVRALETELASIKVDRQLVSFDMRMVL